MTLTIELVLVDLAKAFDRIWHEVLIKLPMSQILKDLGNKEDPDTSIEMKFGEPSFFSGKSIKKTKQE